MLSLNDSVGEIKGIGEKKFERLKVLNIFTVQDLLSHFPYRYLDKRKVSISNNTNDDKNYLVEGILIRVQTKRISMGRTVLECTFKDEGGTFSATFFNMPYLKNSLINGKKYSLYGIPKLFSGLRVWINPEIHESGSDKDRRGIIPVYNCTAGITNNDFNKWIREALANTDLSSDWLSDRLISGNNLCSLDFAYKNIHFPSSDKHYKTALFRNVYDQLLIYQLAIRNRVSDASCERDSSIPECDYSLFINNFPYKLTDGQKKAIEDIKQDLYADKPMNRLIQGDVGAGKTFVAEVGMYICAKSGFQSILMAPTEILATQHYTSITRDMEKFGFKTCLLTSGMKKSERNELIDKISKGDVDIIIGTHAVIQSDVIYNNLGLVITDEQHRFGVNQRKTLAKKGRAVNVCVMSATPIPRTLAATVFGDMDFSIMHGRPAGRKDIITRSFDEESRNRAYAELLKELELGHQTYVVAPSIDSDYEDISSVTNLFQELSDKFKDYKIELIHGKLSSEEKDDIMSKFQNGKVDILVSTTVIEVGIDVPNATVIVIENAERFGLAQMHQLRGRVGRSDKQSYCFLINYSNSKLAMERTAVMVSTLDGFEISERDFELRGPGDIMGTMQSGNYQSKIISLCKYEEILDIALLDANRIILDNSLCNLDYANKYIENITNNDNRDII